MEQEFIEKLLRINTQPENRKKLTSLLMCDQDALQKTVDLIYDTPPRISAKAARALELLAQVNAVKMLPHIETLLKASHKTKDDATIRPLAKIFEIIITHHFNKKLLFSVSEEHLKKITEICFEWMITPQKIAPQAYSMQTLYLLGTHFDWVHKELCLVLKQNFQQGSTGYKNRGSKIIKRIESKP